MDSSSSSYRESDFDRSLDSSRKKRRKIDAEAEAEPSHSPSQNDTANQVKWRSAMTQRTYSVKLVEALQRARDRGRAKASRTGTVRNVADRVLAMSANGRTRWSRAILASKLRISRLRKAKKKAIGSSYGRGSRKLLPVSSRRLPAVEKRVKVLSRLVPGCKGLAVTNLLEEAGDYIAALEMQVRAMTSLTDLLSRSQSLNDRVGSRDPNQA